MKSHDPNQLNIFYDVVDVREILRTLQESTTGYQRVQDKLRAAAAKNQSLIRLQPGYGGSPWIIKIQTDDSLATGWRYFKKFDIAAEAKAEYASMLQSGDYAEG